MFEHTKLDGPTIQAISVFTYAFDGYAYAAHHWPGQEGEAVRQLAKLRESNPFSNRLEETFAVNFFMHRAFEHQEQWPKANSSAWYSMLFLYLHLHHLPIPEQWRHPQLYRSWANYPAGAAERAASEIRAQLAEPWT